MILIVFEINQRAVIQKLKEAGYDPPMPLVVHLDQEVMQLRQAIRLALVSQPPIDREGIVLSLGIVQRRLGLLSNSTSATESLSSPSVQKLLEAFSNIANSIEKIVGAAQVDIAGLAADLQKLDEILPSIHSLSLETNTRMRIAVEKKYQSALGHVDLLTSLLILQMMLLMIGFVILKKRQMQLRDLNRVLQSRIDERSAAVAEAESENRSKSRIVAVASHDLRQPLAALVLYTGMLGAVVMARDSRLVSNMQVCVNSLSELLTDLLDLGKLDIGDVVPKPSCFSLNDLCNSMLPTYGASASEKGLVLRCRHAPNIVLRTDQQLFKRALGNLIDNSLKYTAHGGVLIATRHRFGRMWVEIWDTGIGIPEKDIHHIFEEFKQLGDSTCQQGSGLGLSIAARISTVLNLKIRVQSRPGYGSMFALELPSTEDCLQAELPISLGHAVYTIGVVEGNTHVRGALEAGLQSVGHTVFSAATASELIEGIGQISPDILISDYELESECAGLDAIEELRARYGQKTAAIVLTGNTSPDLGTNLAKHNIAVYSKPIALEVLQREIELAVVQAVNIGKNVAIKPGCPEERTDRAENLRKSI